MNVDQLYHIHFLIHLFSYHDVENHSFYKMYDLFVLLIDLWKEEEDEEEEEEVEIYIEYILISFNSKSAFYISICKKKNKYLIFN